MWQNNNGEHVLLVHPSLFINFLIFCFFDLLCVVAFVGQAHSFDKYIAIAIAFVFLMLSILVISACREGGLELIYISEKGIRYKDTTLSWDEVYITLATRKISTSKTDCYDYLIFDTKNKDGDIQRGGRETLLALNTERLALILKYYEKEISIFPKRSLTFRQKQLRKLASEHNSSITNEEYLWSFEKFKRQNNKNSKDNQK